MAPGWGVDSTVNVRSRSGCEPARCQRDDATPVMADDVELVESGTVGETEDVGHELADPVGVDVGGTGLR